ncbi:MAG TPA: response regulator [Rhodobacteraceae bacterium]|nr:response regulator [Paracoccaceae bacterium]
MIDPDDPLEIQVEKLTKIVESLMWRVEQNNELGNTSFALFQTAINLENQVRARTSDLESALADLEETHSHLSEALKTAEQSKENLLNALEAMNEGFALFSDDRLVICNKRFQNLFPDISEKIRPGMDFNEYTAAVAASQYLDLGNDQGPEDWVDFRMGNHGRRRATFVVRLKDDRWIQVSERRMSMGNAAILHTDITDLVRQQRQEREEILDRQASQARAILDHMSQGVCTFDTDYRLAGSNSRFRDLLLLPVELSRDGAVLKDVIDYLENNDVLEEKSLCERISGWVSDASGQNRLRLELRRTDGCILDAHFFKQVRGGFVASFTDVTTERQATAELFRAKATLEQSVIERTSELTKLNQALIEKTRDQERVEQELREAKEASEAANISKTRFLAAASHDLLQPLNAAKLFISSLQDTELAPRQKEIATRLERSFGSVESILHALLDISRLDANGVEFSVSRVSMNTLMQTLWDEFEPLARQKGIELKMVPCSQIVESDPIYLSRILQNLLSNAVKYTRNGKVLFGCRRRNDELEVQVLDTGLGIAESDQERVFEEYFRLDNTDMDQGVGLGLSFVERACKQLGHRFQMQSRLGRGSMFSVRVPASRNQTEFLSTRQNVFVSAPDDYSDLLVALVENDSDVLFAMTHTLEQWGASVIPARSTEQLMEQVDEIGVPPDIIIADYHLNGTDTGLRSIASLRSLTGHAVPGIIATADRSRSLRDMAQALGVELLTKPIEAETLRSLMKWQLGRHDECA